MKTFVKFLKKLIWFLEIVLLFAISAGVIYGVYDYHTGGAEKYEKMYTQAVLWLVNVKNTITGEESAELTLEEVSPSKTPIFNLSLEGSGREDLDGNRNCVAYDTENKPVIFVYGKDIGGNLYFCYGLWSGERLDKAWLFTGDAANMTDITEHVSWNQVSGVGIVSEEFMMSLEPGEYCIFLDPVNEEGEGTGAHYVPLIVEEQTTYISTQQGFAGSGGEGNFIYNNLQNVQPILVPFYNLGDDRILMIKELVEGMPGQIMERSIDSSLYEILPAGNAIILSEEYLSGFSPNEMRRYKVLLSSGKSLDVGYTRFFTIDGEPDWLSVTGPDIYDLSEGGDFVLNIHKGWAMSYHCVSIWFLNPDDSNVLLIENLSEDFNGDNPLLNEEQDQIVIPASVMQSLNVDSSYNLVLAYTFPGNGFINYSVGFRVVP